MADNVSNQIKNLDQWIKNADNSLKHLLDTYTELNQKASNRSTRSFFGTETSKIKKDVIAAQANIKTLSEEIRNLMQTAKNPKEIEALSKALKDLARSSTSFGSILTTINRSKQVSQSLTNRITQSTNWGMGALSRLNIASAYDAGTTAANRYSTAAKNANVNTSNLLMNARRLASAFGVAFSVQGLVQFGKKLVETRGEFEMQFVAMKQIIGDVDAATKIWNQTMQQALQSPFKAMQLVDYTKKLAAYRIETEKLFDTTKRLADVSAGLGVDMSRLILAYGQVKAANFLRASEIRQFTEAGVNIVGQLSDYFTELEGRAVSTADVMERVSKRMVMFSDVEEIFKRMTDEGGEFYKMQEVQADTVKGQLNKLHDAYDQMLNTIGQANQGTIRDFVEALNNLVRNWRDVAHFLELSGIGLLIWRARVLLTSKDTKIYAASVDAASKSLVWWNKTLKAQNLTLSQYITHLKKAEASAAGFDKVLLRLRLGAVKLNAALKAIPSGIWWFAIIEGLSLIMTKIGEADRAAKQLTKDLDEVGKRNAQSLQDNIDGFTDLVERLKKATEGSQDYLDIRNKIQNQYGEYLDNLEAEQITVENLANSYDRVVERMREKSRQHIMEEGLQEIEKTYSDAYLKFTKVLEGTKVGNIKLSSGEAEDIAKKMYDLYSKNPSRYKNANKLFLDALKQYGLSGVAGGTEYSERKEFFESIEQRYKKQLELESKANSLTKAKANTHAEYLDQLAAQEEHEREIAKIESKTALSTEKKNYLIHAEDLRYQEKKLELLAKYGKKSDEWLDNEKAKLKDNLNAFLNSYNTRVEAYVGSVYGADWREKDNVAAFKDYEAMIATQSRIAQGQSRWEEAILNDKKTTEDNIKRLKEQQATQTARDAAATAKLNEDLEKENHRLELIRKQMELLGLHEKDKSKGGGSANNSIYGDRIRLLQDMLQKYRQAAKEAYGFAKAEEKTGQSFEDAWNSIMPAGYGELEVPTSYSALAEMLQRLEQFTPQFDEKGKLSKMMADLKKAISDSLSQVDFEMSVRIREDFGRQMEEAFGNYELTLDIQKLNLPSDVLADLFDVDAVTLADLRSKVSEFYEDRRAAGADPTELIKQVEGYYKKIDDMERKQQRERIKDYAKYLEYELSERAKMEMEYVRKIAEVEAESAFNADQKADIKRRLKKEYEEKIAKQEWEDFKGSEMYIQMMEDLEHQGIESLQIMRQELERIRDNAENLSPRALKEVINAIEKINDIEVKRGGPISNIFRAKDALAAAKVDVSTVGLRESDVSSRAKTRELLADLQARNTQLQIEYDKVSKILGKEEEYYRLVKEQSDLREKYAQEENLARYTNMGLEAEISKLLDRINKKEVEIRNAKKGQELFTEKQQEALQGLVADKQKEINDDKERLEILNKELKLRIQIATIELERETDPEKIEELKKQIKELEKQKKELEEQIGVVTKVEKAYQRLFDNVEDGIQQIASAMQELYSSAKGLAEASGADTSSGVFAYGDATSTTLGAISKVAEAVKNGNPFKIAVVALTGLMDSIAAFFGASDAKLEAEIQTEQKRIETLQRAYERLEKQIERTYDTFDYMDTYNQQVANLRSQIDALAKQRAAEEDKKNTDKDKVQGYSDAIEDAYNKLEELQQKQIEVFGGIGKDNYRSWSEGFVDAWKSAFLETGDGLDALQDHFDEFLQEWFVKQATMRIAGKALEGVMGDIDNVVSDDGIVDWNELQAIRSRMASILPDLNDKLTQFAGMFDLSDTGSLSGLAAGIQGMTEEQANILEAYWNSVRMYTASIDMNVSRIAEMLGAGGPNTNPMLTELETIASHTSFIPQIYTLLTGTRRNLGNGQGFVTYNQ